MFIQGTFFPGMATGVVPAPQLLIGYDQAWVLILSLLVLCCALFWLLTKPAGRAARQRSPLHRSTRPALGRRRRIGSEGERRIERLSARLGVSRASPFDRL